MIHITQCPVCASTNLVSFLSTKDYTLTKQQFEIVRCTNCYLGITSPQPEPSALGNFYESPDYISHTSKSASLIDSLYLVARNFTLKWKRKLVHTTQPNKKLLDYGCGTGDFLKAMLDDGWKISGVEPSTAARTQALSKTQTEIAPDIEQLTESDYTAITLWHVLEHIPDPNFLLKQLSSRLSSNGTIFIAVPNYASFDAELYQQFWAGYDVPRHLWHFSQENMKKLLEKNHFTLKDIVPMKLDSFYVSMLSEKYKKGKNTPITMMTAFFNGLRSNQKASKTSQYSSLIYVATK